MNGALKHGKSGAAGDMLDARALVDLLEARLDGGSDQDPGREERKQLTDALEGLARRLQPRSAEGERNSLAQLESRLERNAAALGAEVAELRTGLARLAQAAHESLEELDAKLEGMPEAATGQVRRLEQQVESLRALLLQAQRDMHARLEDLMQDGRSAPLDGVAELARRAADMAERQEAAIAHLGARLEALGAPHSEPMAGAGAAAMALQAVQERLDAMQAEQARQRAAEDVQAARIADLAARLEERPAAVMEALQRLAARLTVTEEALARDAGPELRSWVEDAADRARRAAESASETVLERHAAFARETQQQIELAARRSDAAVDAFAAQQQALSEHLSQLTQRQLISEAAVNDVRAELEARAAALAAQAEAALESARRELDARVAAAIASVHSNSLGEGLNAALARVGVLENGQRALAQEVSVELKRWSEALDRRMRGHESRLTTESDALRRLVERFERLESHAVEAAGDTRDAMTRLAARIEERASAAERKAAHSLEQVGGQIVDLAERMDARQRAMLRDTTERLEAVERQAAASAAGYASQLLDRLTDLELRVAEIARGPAAPPPDQEPQTAFQLSWSAKGAVRPLSGDHEDEDALDIEEFAEAPNQPTYALVDVLDAMMAAQRTAAPQPDFREPHASATEAAQEPRPFVDGFDPALAACPVLDAAQFSDLFDPADTLANPGKRAAASGEPAFNTGVVLRTLLWATAVIAVSSSIYAFSRGARPVTGENDLDEALPRAEQRKATARAANRVLEAAADRIEMNRRFAPAAVDLPGPDAEELALADGYVMTGSGVPLALEREH